MGGKRILGMCCHQCCECYNCCKALEEVSADDYIDKKKKLKSKLHKDNFCKQMLRGFGGFSVAIMLTASYALIVLFVKHYNLWFCLVSTVCIGFFLSMAMALSKKVRATVFLMLPSYFSSQAEAVIIVVILSLTMQGPVYNILKNFHQSARSVSCGVELAINQTKELLEKAKHPLVGAIDYLKNAGRKLKFVGDRARQKYKAIVSGVKHAGRSLLRVWRFMFHMEEICNEELGTPYARCMKIFDDGKNKCRKALSFLAFLCYVVDTFQPLCGLAKTPLLFCLIPRYVENFMNKRIKNPIENMLNKLKGQFKFNMTIIHDFDVHINSSQHTSEMAYSIMNKVQEVMDPYVELLGMISYSVLIVNIYVYYMALMYRRQYLFDDNYDNIYITRKFIELDVMRAKQGRRTLLPLNSIEAYHFIQPSSLFLTRKEIRGYTFKIFNIFRTLLVVVFVIIIDYLIFWVLDMVAYLLEAEVVARAPVVISVHVNGSGYTADIYRNIVAAFDILQRGNVSVVSKKCAIVPSEPDYRGYVLLGVMFGVAFFISLFGVYINRLRHSICAWYYPSREQERICFLYNNLMANHEKLKSTIIKSVKLSFADEGHTSFLFVLATKLPFCGTLARILGFSQRYCMACASICLPSNSQNFFNCLTPGCKGLYCYDCYEILNHICTICMAPLAYEEALDEELDSSDEERVSLWLEAMKTIKKKEKEKRLKMKRLVKAKLREIIKARGTYDQYSKQLMEKYSSATRKQKKHNEALKDESSELSDLETSYDSGETDFDYQNKLSSSDYSESESNTPKQKFRPLESENYLDLVTPDGLTEMAKGKEGTKNKQQNKRQKDANVKRKHKSKEDAKGKPKAEGKNETKGTAAKHKKEQKGKMVAESKRRVKDKKKAEGKKATKGNNEATRKKDTKAKTENLHKKTAKKRHETKRK